jgi:hypothetical protein
MKNKKMLVLGIALVLFALVSGTLFAQSLVDGHYAINFFGGGRGAELLGYTIEEISIRGNRLEFYAPNRDRPVLSTTARVGGGAYHFQDSQGRNYYFTVIDSKTLNFNGARFYLSTSH